MIKIIWLLMTLGASAGAQENCECPKVTCGSCEQARGLEFYTEKRQCPTGMQLISCSRPKCAARVNAPECLQAGAPAFVPDAPAAAAVVTDKPVLFGQVEFLRGEVTDQRQAQSRKLKMTDSVYVGDQVVTGKDGEARIRLLTKDVMHIPSQSQVSLEALKSDDGPTVLKLIRGRLRSQVQKGLSRGAEVYEVHTRSGVAGVRGTDFVTSFSDGAVEQTTVQTLEGRVVLFGFRNPLHSEMVSAGHEGLLTLRDEQTPGELTLREMNEEAMRELEKKSYVGDRAGEHVARAGEHPVICQKPGGRYNECSWTLVNKQCMRQRCNANGIWADPVEAHGCQPGKTLVAPCDY